MCYKCIYAFYAFMHLCNMSIKCMRGENYLFLACDKCVICVYLCN